MRVSVFLQHGCAGLDPHVFSGHSLRAGLCTSAAEHGARVWKMMDVSRHKSVNTLRGMFATQSPSRVMQEQRSYDPHWLSPTYHC
jgi:hypothetical protein